MNKKLIYNIITIIILLCGTIWVCSHFVHLGRVEYTDNAQIRRNIIPINARLQAYIKEIRFSDFDKVRKGDTLVIFENAEYLLGTSKNILLAAILSCAEVLLTQN